MATKAFKADKKTAYDQKLCKLLDEYSQIQIVGSTQLQNIGRGLRGDSVVLMVKNTMMKTTVRLHSPKTGNIDFLNLVPLLLGNVGLIFTKADLKEVREEVANNKGLAVYQKFRYGDEDVARRYFLQILEGLSFMHEKRIAHCDLTIFNVLLDKANSARICDFGLAHFLSGVDLVENVEIQPLESVEHKAFRAPELLQSRNSISEKVDIYSLGVMAVYIFSCYNDGD